MLFRKKEESPAKKMADAALKSISDLNRRLCEANDRPARDTSASVPRVMKAH
jgi:hypothetical protein